MKYLSNEKLAFSEYMKLSKEVPVKLVKVEDSKQVGDDDVFIIGIINKDGIDYYVGVDKRFLSIKTSYGIPHLVVKNRKNRVLIRLKCGGPMRPKRVESGGPMRPKRVESGGPMRPKRVESGGPKRPKRLGRGGLL